VHPGEVLLEEFMKPRGLSRYRLAKELGVPVTRIQDILKGRRGVSAETATHLANYFGCSPELWLGLQLRFELDTCLGKRARLARKNHATNKPSNDLGTSRRRIILW
jgi:antitoxin HigA-1